jgi:hypothetical protein
MNMTKHEAKLELERRITKQTSDAMTHGMYVVAVVAIALDFLAERMEAKGLLEETDGK